MNENKVIILVPARKNSKGIKNKNIYKINGKPLIDYTLDSIKKSKLNIKDCYILSDDQRVKNIGKKYGVNIEYERPKNLSKDKTLFIENLIHFFAWTKSKSINFKYIMILQPTSPLRTSQDINSALKLLKKKPKSVISISESLENPNVSIFFKNKKINFYTGNPMMKRRQDFIYKSYFINGGIYLVSRENLEKNKFINFKDTLYLMMDKLNSFDLNDYDDLKILKRIIR